MKNGASVRSVFNLTVIVGALGYFVDIFDLILYGIVRTESLQALGLSPADIDEVGEILLRIQMAGFFIGGILWGVIGDKFGRKKILFGSITMYSLATGLNAFVKDVWLYGVCRFFAGLGLAGELGAAVTLTAETMPTTRRTYGVTIIASLGLLGAVFANLLYSFLDWKEMYIVGGIMGLILLVFRFGVMEAGIFEKTKAMSISRGNFLALFTSRERFARYIFSILIALPIWYTVGILVVFAREMAESMGVEGASKISNSTAISWTYLGGAVGDMIAGLSSQFAKSRRKIIGVWLSAGVLILISYFIFMPELDYRWYYVYSGALGVSIGYWTLFVTVAAEQFGTNLRATVAVTAPNFIRGSLILITIVFRELIPYFGRPGAAAIVGAICYIIAFYSLYRLKETFTRELDFVERV